jgi:hypothetical protein
MGFRLTVLLFVVLLIFSCNNGSQCFDATDSYLVTTFTGSKEIKIDSIIVKGMNRNAAGDTLYRDKVSALTKLIALPLSLSVDSTGFVLFTNGKSHSLWVRHTMIMQLVSENCGYSPYYKLTGGSHSSLIDSVRITDPVVDPKSLERHAKIGQNIKVYLNLSVK